MKPYLLLRAAELAAQRPSGEVDDVHFTEALAESVIADTTSAGDLVLDPFAGYGTTLVVAERMGREAVGVELLAEHVEHVRARTSGKAQVLHGDARQLADLVDGPVDLVLTSPPYMTRTRAPGEPADRVRDRRRELPDVPARARLGLRPGRRRCCGPAVMPSSTWPTW